MLRQLRSYLSLVARIWKAPGNRGHQPGRVLRSMLWLINKKTARKPWTLPVFNDLQLRCHPDSIIALHVVQRSEWHDWDTAKFITSFLRPGDTFIDVGANIGLYTLPASRIVGDSGTVIAVEPSPINRARLEENLALNHIRTVHIEPCALGEAPGSLSFHDHDALAHLDPSMRSGVPAPDTVTVPVEILDNLVPTHAGVVTLLKVDVEGFELSVFRGAVDTMRAPRLPVILFELNDSHLRYGVTSADIFSFLHHHGYQIARYEHATRRLVQDNLHGDIIAYTPDGLQLIQERLLLPGG